MLWIIFPHLKSPVFSSALNISRRLNKSIIRWFWVNVTTRAQKMAGQVGNVAWTCHPLRFQSAFQKYNLCHGCRLKRLCWGDLSCINCLSNQSCSKRKFVVDAWVKSFNLMLGWLNNKMRFDTPLEVELLKFDLSILLLNDYLA